MNRTRVGVLRGGPSNEHDVSLQSGGTVLKNLSPEKFQTIDIYIDRDGAWHVSGVEVSPHDALSTIDVVFNALHGSYGEDGKVQSLLDRHGIPYTGSGTFASAVGMNKILTKEMLAKFGIKMPKHTLIDDVTRAEEQAHQIFRSFPLPVVVKPATSGSSVGVSIVKKFADLVPAIESAFEHSPVVMIEEYVSGIEATAGVVEGLRGHELYALPPVEIVPTHGGFFDYNTKYNGQSREIVPGNFSHDIKDELMKIAQDVHRLLDLRHYSRSDFIVTPRRGVYFLEVNTQPGLTKESLIPRALDAVGVKLADFLEHIIHLAINRK